MFWILKHYTFKVNWLSQIVRNNSIWNFFMSHILSNIGNILFCVWLYYNIDKIPANLNHYYLNFIMRPFYHMVLDFRTFHLIGIIYGTIRTL